MRLGILLAILTAGCSGTPAPATVKGQLVLDGQPFALPQDAGEVFIAFHAVNEDGTIDRLRMYTALVREDGSFEVVASGGELPVGTFQVSIDAAARKVPQFKPFALAETKAKIAFQSGPNDVKIELNKPGG